MVSVIISSANPAQLKQVTENITTTIGVPFEIIAIDNSKGQRGICAVYNQGIRQAKYDMLCFMHEDVIIKTDNWGEHVLQFFNENTNCGLLGIGGSEYKTIAPSGWNCTGIEAAYINIIQGFKYDEKEPFHYYRNPGNKALADVTCVDGVWFCTPKKVAAEIQFDEQTFTGFHAYDLDFSLAVGRKYKVMVTFAILMQHLSEGNYDARWMTETIKLHKKWNLHLPIDLRPLKSKEKLRAEKATFRFFIDQLVQFKFPVSVAYEMLNLNNRFFNLDKLLYIKLHFYILKRYLGGSQIDQIEGPL